MYSRSVQTHQLGVCLQHSGMQKANSPQPPARKQSFEVITL